MIKETELDKQSIEELSQQVKKFIEGTNEFPIQWTEFTGVGTSEVVFDPDSIFSEAGHSFFIKEKINTQDFFDKFYAWIYGVNEILNDLFTSAFLGQDKTKISNYYHKRWSQELRFLERLSRSSFGTTAFTLFFQDEYFRSITLEERESFRNTLEAWLTNHNQPETKEAYNQLFLDTIPSLLRISILYYLQNHYDPKEKKPSDNLTAKTATSLIQRVSFFNYQIEKLLSLAYMDGTSGSIKIATERDRAVTMATFVNAIISGLLLGSGVLLGLKGTPLVLVSMTRFLGFIDLIESRRQAIKEDSAMIISHEILHLLSASQTKTDVKIGVIYLTKKA